MSRSAPVTTAAMPLEMAARFARVALQNIQQEFPNKLDHVMNAPNEVQSPRALHPIFFGSYDWHSSVHMHWLLVRLLRLHPALLQAGEIRALLDRQFTNEKVLAEIAYLEQSSRATFERTYGWAWLLQLQSELVMAGLSDPAARSWERALQPLADCFVERYRAFLPIAEFPIRAGTHANSAFGLLLALAYARRCGQAELTALIVSRATFWFGADCAYPAAYEPSGDDFLSGGLMEAALMQQVLDRDDFTQWWDGFCPAPAGLTCWLTPVPVSDRTDPKLSHLDGLNLSRAWCWAMLKEALGADLRDAIALAIDQHLAVSMQHADAGAYVGTHWLASFATLALTENMTGR